MRGRSGDLARAIGPAVLALALGLAGAIVARADEAASTPKASEGDGSGATISEVPSPAVNCMTPPADQRVKPQYPAELLRMKEGARVPVELVFDHPDSAPQVDFLNEDHGPFEDAVRAYARTLRIPCMKRDAGPVKLRQEFDFVPNDGRKVAWTTPVDEAGSASKCMRLPSAKEAGLRYPEDLLHKDLQGTVIVVLHFTSADAPPTFDVLYDGGHRHFVAAVQSYIAQLRLPCFTGQPYDMGVHFNFRIEGAIHKRIFNDLTLTQFLSVVKPFAPGSAFYDTTKMKCPFDVRLRFRQPYAPNQVSELDEDVPERHAFIDWLARQEIDTAMLGKIPAAQLLDESMTIHVPCATIDL